VANAAEYCLASSSEVAAAAAAATAPVDAALQLVGFMEALLQVTTLRCRHHRAHNTDADINVKFVTTNAIA
jgi:hypothetical protein